MQAVDLSTFVFDYDLTLAAPLMHPDGPVYHRFGGRDERNPEGWNTIAGLAALLRRTLPEHRRYDADPRPPELPPPRTVVELPPLQRKRAGEANPSCVHCHTVHDTLHAHALETRSEERRVGKEWRSRRAPEPQQTRSRQAAMTEQRSRYR